MDNQMMGGKPMEGMKCSCSHHKVVPVVVVLFGVAFLLQALNVLDAGVVAVVWPILVIIAGGMKLMSGKCKCC
jgi:hypothetical protein